MGVSVGSRNAPLIGGQTGSRLCMVRCRWRGKSPSLTSGFQGCDNPWIVFHLRQGDAHPIRVGLVRFSKATKGLGSMGLGERSLPSGSEEGLHALIGATGRGDATGARRNEVWERAPLPRWGWYYHSPHLADHGIQPKAGSDGVGSTTKPMALITPWVQRTKGTSWPQAAAPASPRETQPQRWHGAASRHRHEQMGS